VKVTDISHIAGYLFVIGLIAAVIAGIVMCGYYGSASNAAAWSSIAFAALGAIIGILLSTSKKLEEEIYVLVAASLGLLVASRMNVFGSYNAAQVTGVGAAIDVVIGYIAVFSAAAMIVLAIRTLTHFHVSKIK
jgi:hypothetical protein